MKINIMTSYNKNNAKDAIFWAIDELEMQLKDECQETIRYTHIAKAIAFLSEVARFTTEESNNG